MTVTNHRGETVLLLTHVYLVEQREPVEASA